MAATEDTFTGDGSTTNFAFTFKWLKDADIKVSVNDVVKTAGTHYNLTNLNYSTKTGGTVAFITTPTDYTPGNGAEVRIYRSTNTSTLNSTFVSGSSIRAKDLNDNFTQILYVSEETSNFASSTDASAIQSTANTALANSTTALTTANAAEATANGLAASISTANSNATTAVNTANTASSNATTALNAANAALPKVGGTMTGDITFSDSGEGISFSDASKVSAISNSTSTTSSTTAASSTAVKSAYDLADAALPKTSVSDSTSTTSSTTAASSTAVRAAYDLANAALPKSGGTLTSDLTLNAQSDLRFADSDSSNWVALQAPATVASNVTWTLPDADGSAGTILGTDGSGNLSWVNGRMVLETAQASTSGTSIDFTGIPSWVKRVTVMVNGVSTNGTSIIQIQIGDSGGVETTGYAASTGHISTTNNTTRQASSTTGFPIIYLASAATTYIGSLVLTHIGSNAWICAGTFISNDGNVNPCAGTKTLTATLDRVRLTTVNGTDTFDAGTVGLIYEG